MITNIIPIPSNDDKIYRQILGVLNFIIGLPPQEIQVLAEIIRLNNEYIALPDDKRAKFILSTGMRKEIRELLNIEEKQFNGLIAKLKKKSFMGSTMLSEEGVLHSGLFFKPDDEGFKIEIILTKVSSPVVNIPEKKTTVSEEIIEPVVENSTEEIPEEIPESEKVYKDVPADAKVYYDDDFTNGLTLM